jgi:hypothetical protein
MRSMYGAALSLLILLTTIEVLSVSFYHLNVEYAGQSFLDGYDFYTVSVKLLSSQPTCS